jgi:predicted SAM-dependent methyltransferase
MKLHLGCGQRYLEGYVNIDFPSSEHTVQEKSVADVHADLVRLRYPAGEVEEVRLHHVFEHFPRPVACALLASWNSWLRDDGLVHIEVPDLTRTAWAVINPFSRFQRRAVAERHLFGSHEAPWAVHCEGYSKKLLSEMLNAFGFEVVKVRRNSWRGTYNLEIIGRKKQCCSAKPDFDSACREFLSQFLVDSSEVKLLEVWMELYRAQLDLTWAVNA